MGLVSADDGWRMPDWLWERVEPLLPPPPTHPLGCHRPRVPDRDAMDAILLVLRTGMQWNALNATGICSSSSAHRRFQEWVEAGCFTSVYPSTPPTRKIGRPLLDRLEAETGRRLLERGLEQRTVLSSDGGSDSFAGRDGHDWKPSGAASVSRRGSPAGAA